MAEDEIRKHAKAAVRALGEPGKSWKHKAGEIVMEIMIIIFAVSISIWFHNWSESWKDRADEKEFLSGLRNDLQADMAEMKSDRASYKNRLRSVFYFEKVGAGLPFSEDSLARYRNLFDGYTQISPRISRFEALKSSGRLDIILNKKLLIDIADLYTKNFPEIAMVNNSFSSIRQNNFYPFIASHLQLDKQGNGTNWQEMLRTSEMRILIHMGEAAGTNIDDYTTAIEKCEGIVRQIDQELKEG